MWARSFFPRADSNIALRAGVDVCQRGTRATIFTHCPEKITNSTNPEKGPNCRIPENGQQLLVMALVASSNYLGSQGLLVFEPY